VGTEHQLRCHHIVDAPSATTREELAATTRFIRDLIAHRWIKTARVRERTLPKRIHYMSMEYLLGRTLRNNIMNLSADPPVRHALKNQG
jgi:glycogen phosphorylase